MGTIAAREALRVCELVGRALAVDLLLAAQACELRGGLACRPDLGVKVSAIRALSAAVIEDRPLDVDIEAVYQDIAAGSLGQSLVSGGSR